VPFARLLLLLLLFPFLDFALLAWIAGRVPFDWTFSWVAGTAILGVFVIRRERISWLGGHARKNPSFGLLDHFAALLAGFLLILPGVIGDVLGLMLLVPWVRRPLLMWGVGRLMRRVVGRFGFSDFAAPPPSQRPGPRVIDVKVVDPKDSRPSK
jgi:UPF0716 protein FxsA